MFNLLLQGKGLRLLSQEFVNNKTNSEFLDPFIMGMMEINFQPYQNNQNEINVQIVNDSLKLVFSEWDKSLFNPVVSKRRISHV